ncbi:YcaO-like family protein [Clostridium polynesiense]|uniref:YcaO-like family protein n=1 Tax=Clostridium polynesiense TaxID=1325933 RepID=UPI00058C974C|nr:YcaO-like family protein [Clostridium polynesiense]
MLRYYPSNIRLKNKFKSINAQHFGIMESQILTTAKGKYSPEVSVCTANMPDYHKIIIDEKAEMNHHLSGYGIYFEESLIRLLGEGIERYALLTASEIYKDKEIMASYNEVSKLGEVMPWEYIDMYTKEDYDRLLSFTNIQKIDKDTKISWIKCPSILDKDREILIPAQLLFIGFRNKREREAIFAPGFSKGAASHVTLENALESAMMESVEADAFTINWYTSRKTRKIIVDDESLLEIIIKTTKDIQCDVLPLEFSLEGMPGHTVGVALINKNNNRPTVVLGCQSALDPKKAIYKALLESLAIHYLAVNGPLLLPNLYLASVKDNNFNNLDSNVAFWANQSDIDMKKSYFYDLCKEEVMLSSLECYEKEDKVEEIRYIKDKISKVSKYGVYLDITPPEVSDKGWKVIRTFFPELVQMSLPSFPYSNHPRLKEYGGVLNALPHPVP